MYHKLGTADNSLVGEYFMSLLLGLEQFTSVFRELRYLFTEIRELRVFPRHSDDKKYRPTYGD